MEFFDINFCIGRSRTGTFKPASSREDLLHAMDALGIREALIWHIAQCEGAAPAGNRLVDDMTKDHPQLHACRALLPPQADEQEKAELFFKNMKNGGAAALRLFPGEHRFLPNRTVFGEFMDQVADRKIPVLLSIGRGINWPELYELLAQYPKLVCIICDTGIWGTDRYFRPLVETYENVYLETSLISLGDGVMEAFVRDYGPDKLLFGTGFPDRIPEAPMLQLLHADIKESEKEAVAAGNSRRLLTEVML